MESTLAFITPLPTTGRDLSLTPCSSCRYNLYRSSTCRRRGRVWASASEQTSEKPDSTTPAVTGTVMNDIDFEDDIVSDETHVVIDRQGIDELIEQLKTSGEDNLFSDDDNNQNDDSSVFDSEFFNAAERMVDERDGRFTVTRASMVEEETKLRAEQAQWSTDISNTVPAIDENESVSFTNNEKEQTYLTSDDLPNFEVMDYFNSENKTYMPRWAREMFENDEHVKLEEASDELSQKGGTQRLHTVVERKKAASGTDEKALSQGDGIIDCTVADVADDYHVPVEFVIDIMISFGAQLPIKPAHSIRDSLSRDEIDRLLKIFLTYDSTDLSERYSDRTISELADDYDVNSEKILHICEREGLFVHAGADTHLSVVREDRVLSILLDQESYGKPYPPLLEGLG